MSVTADVGDRAGKRRVERPRGADVLTGAMLALRVVVVVSVAVDVPWFPSASATRFHEIAHAAGTPYRDVPVEYPIGELLVIEAVGSWSLGTARALLAVAAFAADLVAFMCLVRGWGRDVARRYLVVGAPLLCFLYRRSDLVAVALATAAALCARTGRPARGGALLGVAILTKLWPTVLLPVVALGRRTTGVVAAVLATGAGAAAWLLVGGLTGIRQVATLRGASGWELESTVGAVVWPIVGDHRFEAGANRTGSIPGWARFVMIALLAVGLAAVWWRGRARTWDLAGAPALVAVTILLVLSPVLSPQYLAWLLPWAAIASVDAARLFRAALVPVAVTGAIVALWYLDVRIGRPANQVLMIARNLTLLAIPVIWFAGTSPGARRTPAAAT